MHARHTVDSKRSARVCVRASCTNFMNTSHWTEGASCFETSSSCVQQVKLGSPDYIDCNTEEAIEDFMKRIKCYENSYQPLDEMVDR